MSGGGKSLPTCSATSNNTAASAHGLNGPALGESQRNEKTLIMNHTDGWMHGWMGIGMWLWALIGVAVVVLLVVLIVKLSQK